MSASDDLLIRSLRSTLDLERGIAATIRARLTEAEELLRINAAQFREYERHHLAKSPPDEAKAKRNAALAERIETHLAQPAPVTTTTQTESPSA